MKFNQLPDFQKEVAPIIYHKLNKVKKYGGEAVEGWDIETTRNGDLYILANSKVSFYRPTLEECLTHLLYYGKGKLNFHFNIRFDFDSIIKMYFINMAIPKSEVEYKGFKIKWVDKKYYKISKNGKAAYFFDVANFYTKSLNYNAEKFLNDKKIEINIVEAIQKAESIVDTKEHQQMIDTISYYCKYDADLTRRLGELLITTTIALLGFAPKMWFSKAYLSEVYIKNYVSEKVLKPFKSIPPLFVPKILDYSFKSYKGGLFNIWRKGLCEGTQIDINSAYPDKIAKLIDITNGYWLRVDKYNKQATYGFYKVKHQFDGLMPYRFDNNLIIYPQTKVLYTDFITKAELEYIIFKNLKYELINGYEFYADNISYPFKEVVLRLYKKKKEYKEKSMDSHYMLVKIILNSIYGKFAQTKHGIGSLFNPVYASLITAETRLQIAKELVPLFKEVYEIATDSVYGMVDETKLKPSKELGGYEIVFKGKCIILLSGIKCDDKGILIRSRGFTSSKMNIISVMHGSTLTIKIVRPIHLNEAFAQHKLADINRFEEFEKEQDLFDNKMMWLLPMKVTFEQLSNNSFRGLPLNELQIDEMYNDANINKI